ncbi:MAG: tetratricopeptide repeat protein [Chloroflexi bacterium]|nr:tetratricopeptide repeat protein [Chloroflexota bacterium]
MYIRRDRSNLHFGSQRRRRGGGALLVIWVVTLLLVLAVIWRFDSVQTWVLAGVGGDPTATPNAITLAQQGERAYWRGDLETAIGYYEQAAELAPDNIDIRFELGRVLIYRSYAGRTYDFRAEQALEVAQEAVRIAPDNARAQALLCNALVANDRAEDAIAAGLRAVQLDPEYAEAYAYLSVAYYYAGRPNQAFEAGDTAVQKNPDSLDARRALALSLAFVGEYNAAIQQFERAIQIHPELDVLYFEVATYYKAQNNYEGAIAAYDRVLVMDPDNVKAYTRMCETYFTMREDALAQEACEQAVQMDPTYPEAFRQLGMVRYTSRNFEGAIESFEVCSDLQDAAEVPLVDREIQCWYIRGLAWALLARCDEAWPLFQESLQMNPNEVILGHINDGMMSCVDYGDRDISEIPTPVPPTPVPPEPLGVY